MSEVGHCKDCRHWSPLSADDRQWEGPCVVRNALGLCAKIGDEQDRESQDEEDWHFGEVLPPDGTLAMAADASGMQSMRTAPEFGCVLFEEKGAEPA